MKKADVVEVRDAGPARATEDQGADAARMDRMADILRRYPGVGEAELADLLLFLKKGRHLEIGLVGARDGLGPQLDAVHRDHARHFRTSLLGNAVFLLLALGPVAALAWHFLA